MAAQAVMAGLSAAASAIPLFFGENNIFSGKARRASKELERTFRQSQAMQLPSEYQEALQSRRQMANVGIPGAALGLYQQQAGRQQASQLSALGSRRSALAGIGQIAQAGQDAALNLASMQGQALQSGQERLNQSLMQMGGLKQQEELRKLQEATDYWGTRKAESNAAISSALSGVGSAIGTGMATGAFDKTKIPTDGMTGARSMQNFGLTKPSFSYQKYDWSGGLNKILNNTSLYSPRGLSRKP